MEYHQEDQYTELAHAIALLIYRRCVDYGDGTVEYEHFNDNRLGVPADVLARLGVMHPIGPNEWLIANTHAFDSSWRPSKKPKLIRHSGEPSIFDLIVSLCLLVDWDSQYLLTSLQEETPETLEFLPQLDLCDHQRFSSADQKIFNEKAFRFATLPLIKMGLGSWSGQEGFKLIFSMCDDRTIDLAGTYSETRHNMAKRIGGVQMLFPRSTR